MEDYEKYRYATGCITTTNTTGDWQWMRVAQPYSYPLNLDELMKQQEAALKHVEKEKNLRHLYQIYIVDPKAGKVVHEAMVVAKDQTQAMLKAGIPDEVRDALDEYDVIVTVLGDVRAKKETQKVRVVKDE